MTNPKVYGLSNKEHYDRKTHKYHWNSGGREQYKWKNNLVCSDKSMFNCT